MALKEEFEQQGIWLFRYRSYLPLVILLIGLGVFIYMKTHPYLFFLENTRWESAYELLCLSVGIFGLLIRIYTVGHTPANTSGRNVTAQVADMLNTTGIYSTVRHPLYLGNYLMWLAPALLTGQVWFIVAFTLAYWLYYERIMFAEEQFLSRKFGESYSQWACSRPAFVPKFTCFKRPSLPFSWKKVIKKEKNGLLALLLIFLLFDYTGNAIQGSNKIDMPLLIACVTMGIIYVILKYLKTYTKVLDEENR